MRRTTIVLTGLLLISCGLKPPLVLTREGQGLEVSVATLGEYPTSICRIKLADLETGRSVWELRAKGRVPKIWDFRLEPGFNEAQLKVVVGGQYEIVVPAGQKKFLLEKGSRYEISVWNEECNRREKAIVIL